MCYFPKDCGFIYDENEDEWIIKINKSYLVLYRNLSSVNWSLSLIDEDDYQHFILETYNEVEIVNETKRLIRDFKIESLLI